MSTRTTSRTPAWLIGLLLLVCWNLQAEKNPTPHSVQFTKPFNRSTPATDLPPLSGTATVGVPFSFNLPFLIPLEGTTTTSVTGLPANGLSVKFGIGGPIIGGTPLSSGVMNLTLVNSQTPSGITAFRAITLTVNDPLPPLSGTATVGVPFSFNLPFLIPLEGTTTTSVTGLPANGLSVKQGSGFVSIIGGTPLSSGVMNLTLVNSQTPSGITAFRAITLTVNDPLPPLSGTATVGVPFSFNLPFLIPLEGTTTVNVTGLPANGLSVQGGGIDYFGSVIAGTPLTSGVMNLTLVNSQTPSGLTAFRAITITVNPSATSFAIAGVNLISCQTLSATERQLTFTPQYVGTTGQPINFTVYQQLSLTTQPGPYSLHLTTNNPLITLIAQQNGVLSSYNYPWLAACNNPDPNPNRPPTTTGIANQTAQQGQPFQLSMATAFSDPEGQSLTFSVSGLPDGLSRTGSVISGTPSLTGVFPITATVTDPGGLSVATSFQLSVLGGSTPQPKFSLVGVNLISCQTLSATERQLTFTPQYVGTTGQPILFTVYQQLPLTTQPGPYSLRLDTSNLLLTMIAQQNGELTSLNYQWLAACNASARQGALEPAHELSVRVLGNPVVGASAEVEIRGVWGERVQVEVVDLQGRRWHQQVLEQAGTADRVQIPLGTNRGMLLLQVSTASQRQTVKLLKAE